MCGAQQAVFVSKKKLLQDHTNWAVVHPQASLTSPTAWLPNICFNLECYGVDDHGAIDLKH